MSLLDKRSSYGEGVGRATTKNSVTPLAYGKGEPGSGTRRPSTPTLSNRASVKKLINYTKTERRLSVARKKIVCQSPADKDGNKCSSTHNYALRGNRQRCRKCGWVWTKMNGGKNEQ